MKNNTICYKKGDSIKDLFLFFSLILMIFCQGQTKRFYYELNFKLDSINISRDIVVLDINEHENNFYSNEYLVIDSINNFNKNFKFAYPKFNKILKWTKQNNSFDFTNNISMNFYQYSSKVDLQWTLIDEKKKIGHYYVQKASTEYGGRKWLAWFTTEIPLPFGPYIFYGLPGMIMEIYDTKNDYHFSFVQNKNFQHSINAEKIIEKYLGITKFKIEKKDWKKIQLNYYNNPISEYKSGDAMMLRNDGSRYSLQDYRDIEKNIQERIKKYNNPIELDEKIDYK